jgi:hypothetical protein
MNNKTSRYPLWTKENTHLAIAFLLSTILVYWFPRLGITNAITMMAFLGSLVLVFNSKNDSFWLAWFFLMMNAPGRLFSSTSGMTQFRLPLYNLAPGVSLGFPELFLAAYILKLVIRKGNRNFIFSGYFVFILVYGLLMLFYSLFLGVTAANLITAVRSIAPWAWILILPAFINDSEKLGRVFRMLAPFVFISFIFTIHAQLSGAYLHNLLSGESALRALGSAEDGLIRISHSSHLIFFCMTMSLFYLTINDRHYNGNYLNSILVVAGIMIFMSATRGWILAMFILWGSVFLMGGYNLFKQAARVLVILGIFFSFVGMVYPTLFFQTSQALNRFLTLELLVQGDVTAGGTLARITERSPRVMAVFRESPVIGWGFSQTFYQYNDGHVGNQNMLMQGGVIGYLVWLIPFLLISRRIYYFSRMSRVRALYGNGMLVFLLALLASFVIHSTSGQMLGFATLSQATHLFWALIFTAIMAIYDKAVRSSNAVA